MISLKKIFGMCLLTIATLTCTANASTLFHSTSTINHDQVHAEQLMMDTTTVGNISGVSEADYYYFRYPDTGVLTFKFTSVNRKTPIDIDLCNESGKILESFKNIDNEFTTKELSCCKNELVYLIVHQDNDDSSDYMIETNFVRLAQFRLFNFETEFNDDINAAEELNFNTVYNGMIYNTNDIDYYVVKPTTLGAISFEINVYGNKNQSINASVYSKEAKIADAVTTSAISTTKTYEVTNGDEIVVKLSSVNADGLYYSIKPVYNKIIEKSPTIKNIKRNNPKKFTVKMKKQKYVGYKIQYSTNKHFTKKTTKTLNTKKKTISIKTKKNKTYYVRVKGYNKHRGIKVYSNYSKVLKTKKVKIH